MHQILSYTPFLEPFNLLADVSEGYTVGEHTKRVLERCDLYEKEIRERLEETPLTFESFRTFLALHDVGKGVGHATTFKNPLAFKAAELRSTKDLIEAHVDALGIGLDDRRIYKALLDHDTIGDYLKWDLTIDGALDLIFEGAITADILPIEFLSLMDLFHAIDAGSYPTLQHLFLEGGLNRVDESSMGTLRARVLEVHQGEEAFYSIMDGGKESVCPPFLGAFLQFERVRLVRDSSDTLRTHFKRINKGLTQIYQRFFKFEFCSQLTNDIFHFRRDYAARYKIAKLGKLDCYDPDDIHKITWIHGTNGGIFANFEETGLTLVPTGILRKHDILLLSGELQEGARGINQRALSGCALDSISLAVDGYAKCTEFVDHVKGNRKSFLYLFEYAQKKFDSQKERELGAIIETSDIDWPSLIEKSLLKLMVNDFSFVESYLPQLKAMIEFWQSAFLAFKETDAYRRLMPPQYHDAYYERTYKIFTDSLDQLTKILNGSYVPKCGKVDERLKGVGLIFASTKLVPRCLSPRFCISHISHSEKVIDHPVPLEDITHVFATDHIDVISRALHGRVKVLPMERLEAWIPFEKKLQAACSLR